MNISLKNHACSINFAIISQRAGNSLTSSEILAALRRRLEYLEQQRPEDVVEAVGMPENTYEEEVDLSEPFTEQFISSFSKEFIENSMVVYSPSEAQKDGAGEGFWSNEEGWVGLAQADFYWKEEIASCRLPITPRKDAQWLPATEAAEIATAFEKGAAVTNPKDVEQYLVAAKQHGEDSEPDHEVGDLQEMLRAAFEIMDDKQKRAFAKHQKLEGLREGWGE